MNRRNFIASGLTATAATTLTDINLSATPLAPKHNFKLNYAPHFGMFKTHTGDDFITQLQFFKDQGFNAIEDNGMPTRSIADQEKIGRGLADLKMTMGVFVANKDFDNPTFAVTTWKKEMREPILKEIREAVEIAKRCNA